MKKIVLSVLLVSMFYQLSNAEENGIKDSTSQRVKEESTAKVKESKEDTSSKQDEAKDSQNKQDDEPHYKGKWKYASRTQVNFYTSNDGSMIISEVPYALGFSYRFLDQLKISAYVGLGVEVMIFGKDNSARLSGKTKTSAAYAYTYGSEPTKPAPVDGTTFVIIPFDVTLAYSLTNFHKVGKNLELVVGAGYDLAFDVVKETNQKGSKFRLEAGVQLGRALGFRFSYVPSMTIGSVSESLYGLSLVFAWKN